MLTGAEKYLLTEPDTSQLLKPDVFTHVIRLMLNSFEVSGDKKYFHRADYFGKIGIQLFMDDESPLPKVSNQHNHYETITGGPAFMNELLNIYRIWKDLS